MYAGIYVLNVGDKSVEFAAKLDEGAKDKTVELPFRMLGGRLIYKARPFGRSEGLGLMQRPYTTEEEY